MSPTNKLMKRMLRARGDVGTAQRPLPQGRPNLFSGATPTKPTTGLPGGLRSSAPSAAGNRGTLPGSALSKGKRRRLS